MPMFNQTSHENKLARFIGKETIDLRPEFYELPFVRFLIDDFIQS